MALARPAEPRGDKDDEGVDSESCNISPRARARANWDTQAMTIAHPQKGIMDIPKVRSGAGDGTASVVELHPLNAHAYLLASHEFAQHAPQIEQSSDATFRNELHRTCLIFPP